ncbi:MAG: bifunctional adenosylcobinamide kinase/adenosylcobinamide-phosphate guanylyltransferase [Verrucomicrobia bacterium]|nr:MAG: bifunctional adenosylcobinamide kinase/adenosylcobinamide-phosphate guanylyltransferase [Verrucomicrobiota bacterium]
MSIADGTIHLILGGARSGKSTRAEELASTSDRTVVYVATCRTSDLDAEMRRRIEHHRNRRPAAWVTLEDRYDLSGIAHEYPRSTILVDCLTLWIANEMDGAMDDDILSRLMSGLEAMVRQGVSAVIVSNEVGMGIVPLGPENRRYRDLVGRANQLVAQKAQNVDFMAAGLVMRLKDFGRPCNETG